MQFATAVLILQTFSNLPIERIWNTLTKRIQNNHDQHHPEDDHRHHVEVEDYMECLVNDNDYDHHNHDHDHHRLHNHHR